MSGREEITSDIENFISEYGAGNCYIGITNNVRRRFSEHNLLADNGNDPRTAQMRYITRDAGTEDNAREIEMGFIGRHENIIHGGPGGGGNDSRFVYIYLVIPGETNEDV